VYANRQIGVCWRFNIQMLETLTWQLSKAASDSSKHQYYDMSRTCISSWDLPV